jgi:hypothetical protein
MDESGGNALRKEAETQLAIINARIAWVLDQPHISDWLKQALRIADGHDPIMIQNELEMLRALLLPRAAIQVQIEKCVMHTLVERSEI